MSGFDVIEWIKNFSPEIRIIAITANPSNEFKLRAQKAGATDYIEKGSDMGLMLKGLILG